MAEQHVPDTRRPHTGRRRNEAARQAILDAALCLVTEDGYEGFAMERLAREAGVGKQTIYRWWPDKAAVLAEAIGDHAQSTIPLPDTGTLADDLAEFFTTTFRQSADCGTLALLRQLMAASLQDPGVAEVFRTFLARRRAELRTLLERGVERGEVRAGTDIDFLTDLGYGLLWYRGLVGHRPLDDDAAAKLAACLTAAAT